MIMAIPNKYKNTLDDLIDSSDTESPDQPKSPDQSGSIDKMIRNSPRLTGALLSLMGENCLDKDVSIMVLKRALKTQDSSV